MRYSRLQESGSDRRPDQGELLLPVKPGESMTVGMTKCRRQAGSAPPSRTQRDRRSAGPMALHYLRSFYRGDTRATGWNNIVFDMVGMRTLCGICRAKWCRIQEGGEHEVIDRLECKRQHSPCRYDARSATGNYLVWMGEPAQVHAQAAWASSC